MVEEERINYLQEKNYPIKFLHCDGAGENRHILEVLKQMNKNVMVEFTAPDNPKHNGTVE